MLVIRMSQTDTEAASTAEAQFTEQVVAGETESVDRGDVARAITALSSALQTLKRLNPSQSVNHGSDVVLVALSRCGPTRPSDLAQTIMLDLSTVSRYARSLGEEGLLAKAADQHDRRAHCLALTDRGIDRVERLWAERIDQLKKLIGHWSKQDLTTLTVLAGRLASDAGAGQPARFPVDIEEVREVHRAALRAAAAENPDIAKKDTYSE
jgi:DNA-binding MarR family transcriptional regulator